MGLYVDTSNVPKQYFGLNNLDQKLEQYLNYEGGFFVELGANNGVQQSNTLYYEKYRNWRGVLVEPIMHLFFQCRANRAHGTKIYCNACTSFDYKYKFVEIIYSNLMSISRGLESDILDPVAHAREGKECGLHLAEDNVLFGALASPLNDILNDAGAPELIDFLSLDVEGVEIEVLKGVNHDQFKFKYMCIESRSIESLRDYLSPKGYELIDKLSQWDYVFKLKKS